MAKPSQKVKSVRGAEVELEPDAWPRFERFIRDIAKAGPQHRPSAKPNKVKSVKAKKKAKAR
jgi:hypothetical protein